MTALAPRGTSTPAFIARNASFYRVAAGFGLGMTALMTAIVFAMWETVQSTTLAGFGFALWAISVLLVLASEVVAPRSFAIESGTVKGRDIWLAEWTYVDRFGNPITPADIQNSRYDPATTRCWRDLRPSLTVGGGIVAVVGLIVQLSAFGHFS